MNMDDFKIHMDRRECKLVLVALEVMDSEGACTNDDWDYLDSLRMALEARVQYLESIKCLGENA